MKKVKNLVFLVLLGVITSILLTSSVSAAGWKSTLNLPYGTIHSGASRNYKQGLNKISIAVDGFNTSSGRVRKSGSTTMGLDLWDASTGRSYKYVTSLYTYGTCKEVRMGTYEAGYRTYTFFSDIYNNSTGGRNYYDGVKSNAVYMYPVA